MKSIFFHEVLEDGKTSSMKKFATPKFAVPSRPEARVSLEKSVRRSSGMI